MGDISVIARRLADGHVQHGWCGNGGYFKAVGARLLQWYTESELVEYLFGLGQLQFLGVPGSEQGGYSFYDTHSLTGTPHYLGEGENAIFSELAFVDYAYLYDIDKTWYYIAPRMFTMKIPLEFIKNILDENGDEFDYLHGLETRILEYILKEYVNIDEEFNAFIAAKGYNPQVLFDGYKDENYPMYEFARDHEMILDYFDEWIVVKTNEDNTEVVGFELRKDDGKHIETCEW